MAVEEDELHGDILEAVFAHVPLVHLVAAAAVSGEWNDAVSASLRYLKPPRPWLIVHEQSTRAPYSISARAYDPRSDIWIDVPSPPMDWSAGAYHLDSSNSGFLFAHGGSRLRFSSDALNFEWRDLDPPAVSRCDAIVARVGDFVVVAGGAWDFEDDAFAVEAYDLKSGERFDCDSMPLSDGDSGNLTSLSVAVAGEKSLVVASKETGVTHWFDPETRSWSGPSKLAPDVQLISRYLIGCTNQGLVLVGVCGPENIKVWRIDQRNSGRPYEIGEMPPEFARKVKSANFGYASLNVAAAGCMIYLYNDTWDVQEVVACELLAGGGCGWWSVRHVAAREDLIGIRLVYTCSEVGIEELRSALRTGFSYYRNFKKTGKIV
ncbi:hypothetical protein M569_07013 [Genlisea aurea]|uniref:F-box domain-containing protein n=1 Tax=Genlisea aurea TaxID=192259 RepID=S8E5V3_9LAMI|nr:hypothetical protein M569_07013 [Genlisea aurea]